MKLNLKDYSKKEAKIILKFKSFHKHNLNIIMHKILQKTRAFGFFTKGYVSLPTKIQRFTVLRSPHVDKKSREQFEIKTYNKLLIAHFNVNSFFDRQRVKLYVNFIKNSSCGSSIIVKYHV